MQSDIASSSEDNEEFKEDIIPNNQLHILDQRRRSSEFNHTLESNLLDFNEERFNEETAGANFADYRTFDSRQLTVKSG